MVGPRTLLRLLAFAVCGAAGEIFLLAVAVAAAGTHSVFADVLSTPALAVAPGAAVGLMDGIGFAIGDARRRSRPPEARANRSRAGVLAGYVVIAAVVASGCVFGLGAVAANPAIAWFVASAAVAAVALAHGLAGGADEGVTALGAALFALLLGTGCGALFGLSAGVTAAATYQPRPHTIYLGPMITLVVAVAFCAVVGAALGIVLACAQCVGRLLVPPRMARAAVRAE